MAQVSVSSASDVRKDIVEVQGVSVSFGKVKALQDVSLTIREGEIFGLVGADGAGKTTLQRVMATLCTPDRGCCSVMGHDVQKHKAQVRDAIGFVHSTFSLYTDLTIDENIEFFAAIHGVKFDREDPLLKSIYSDIAPFGNRLAGKLSGGMKQKLAICCALIFKPKVLILNEPTTGIDATSRQEIWEELKRINSQHHVTIIVSTPYRSEMLMCHRIARMAEGRVTEVGNPNDLLPAEDAVVTNRRIDESAENVIEIRNLVKAFGSFRAVNDISFEVKRGEIFGFLGANGAGKTTAINVLCGLTHATSGSGHVAGCDIIAEREKIKQHIGYMSQHFSLYEDLSVRDNLIFFSGIYGIGGREAKRIVEEHMHLMGFDGMENQLAGHLSLGWKQRLAFAVATLHHPEIVFLDEPTSGVDVETRRRMWDVIRQEADRGTTIFITTHYMEEALYCDRQSIMVDGKICAIGHLQTLVSMGVSPDFDDVFDLITMARK